MTKPQLDTIIEIYHDKITEPIDPMRTEFDRDKIYELAESIKKVGLIEPIILRWKNDKLEIVAGHRRFKANAIAGFVKIKCIVREMTNDEMMIQRAHENLIREDVDPVDQALYIGKLVGDDEAKIESVAKMMDKSIQWVEDRLRILTYPDYFLPSLNAGKIKLGVAKALSQIGDEVYRKMFFDNAVRDGMTVWQADYYLAQWLGGVYTDSSKIIPVSSSDKLDQPIVIRQHCEKCGTMAESPNLRNVFIHIGCPVAPTVDDKDTDHNIS